MSLKLISDLSSKLDSLKIIHQSLTDSLIIKETNISSLQSFLAKESIPIAPPLSDTKHVTDKGSRSWTKVASEKSSPNEKVLKTITFKQVKQVKLNPPETLQFLTKKLDKNKHEMYKTLETIVMSLIGSRKAGKILSDGTDVTQNEFELLDPKLKVALELALSCLSSDLRGYQNTLARENSTYQNRFWFKDNTPISFFELFNKLNPVYKIYITGWASDAWFEKV